MTDPTYTKLRDYRRRVADMLADPECGGDLLALGIALLDFAILKVDTDKSWEHYADMAWGVDGQKWRKSKIRDVLRKDIRRYDAIKDADNAEPYRCCGAPMIRRQGPCGQSATIQGMLTDADTGRKQWLAACTRHRSWFEDRARANRITASETAGVVRPAANAGGVLARHIPEIDWHKTWEKLDPAWTPPPEAEPEIVPLKPRLTLVLGGAS